MTQTMIEYLSIARQLPRPTMGQTERFARFVAEAHSWYKHLPIVPKEPFVFFLDPGAGMSNVQTATGEMALLPITDESTRFHYTWQKTEDYRRRFGHWNYHAPYGSGVYLLERGTLVGTQANRLTILTNGGDWVSVPPDLSEKGTSLVSAMVHSMPSFNIWAGNPKRFGLPELSPEAKFDSQEFQSALQAVLDKCTGPRVSDLVTSIPSQLLESCKTLTKVRGFLGIEGAWDWPDDEWLEQRLAEGISAPLVSILVKYLDLRSQGMTAERMFGKMLRERWGTTDVFVRIAEERGRELLAMTTAMNQFADAIYQERA